MTNTIENVGQGYDIVVALKQNEDLSKPKQNNVSSIEELNDDADNEKIVHMEKASSRVEGVVTYGPWGGTGGYVFDDGHFTGIRQIKLSHNVGIVWIRVLYDLDGEAVWGYKHGGTGGFKSEKILFDYPYEVLTHISGYYGPVMYMGPCVIKSLTFHSNKRAYGLSRLDFRPQNFFRVTITFYGKKCRKIF
ncbi:putative jacalin-like lectin domain-containing protein [Lupinus albus]|uniref:Putative jacalin-like lectin domain-containing protein n=1 Tax=Lupinus albus TaxID=3870 RepID=A0A6A4NKI7_LUPAL|nr:putative jacalin-like lectin domain-containing protein [Lupinus albus]